jgi:hypothetical protein
VVDEPDWENGQLEEILRLEAENEQLRAENKALRGPELELLRYKVAMLIADGERLEVLTREALALHVAAENENEQLRRIFNHLTRYATFWSAVRYAEEHMKSLDENVLTEADIAYLRGLPS